MARRPKRFKSWAAYRRFLAYIHMRRPDGRLARHPGETISAQTPKGRKEPVVIVAGRRHHPKITDGR
jgi:hypothetical protein